MVAYRIRFERAAGRCECRGECGRDREHLVAEGRCGLRHGEPAEPGAGPLVTLALAHLDHDRDHQAETNLIALCQGCLLAFDQQHHVASGTHGRDTAMYPLFDLDQDQDTVPGKGKP